MIKKISTIFHLEELQSNSLVVALTASIREGLVICLTHSVLSSILKTFKREEKEGGKVGGEGEKERWGWNIDSKNESSCEVGITLLLSSEQSKDTEDRSCHHQNTIQLKEKDL